MKREDITALFPEATEEQVSSLLGINGADIQRAKGSLNDVQARLNTAQEEINRLKEGPTAEKLQAEIARADGLQQQLDALQQADSVRQIREKVAAEKKIPAALLTGDTEDSCKTQADAILAFANPAGYPSLKDGGEPSGAQSTSTRDSFAGWAEKLL